MQAQFIVFKYPAPAYVVQYYCKTHVLEYTLPMSTFHGNGCRFASTKSNELKTKNFICGCYCIQLYTVGKPIL